jgi:hypothetical protein
VAAEGGRRPPPPPTLEEIKQWPATVDVSTAASAFGISRSHAYDLVGRGEFPAEVLKFGTRCRVITASIVRALSGGGDD